MKTIQFRKNSIIALGDTHSYMRTQYLLEITPNLENSDIVFCGDGGEGFGSPKMDEIALEKINKICVKRNIRFFCIRGNHCNPNVWVRGYNFSNMFLVSDYTEGIFPNGKSCLLVGGGLSIDRSNRKENLDYWSDEITVYQKINKKFDILFSHDTADYFNHSTESLKRSPYAGFLNDDKNLFQDALNQRLTMGQIISDIEPRAIFHGHFHQSISEKKNGIFCRCLNIKEFLQIDTHTI